MARAFEAHGATLTFQNNGLGQNVWNSADNWLPQSLPDPTDTAVASSNVTTELYVTDGNGLIPSAASVGTLILTDGTSQPFALRATGSSFISGHTTAPASLTFGTGGSSPTFGGFDGLVNRVISVGGDAPQNEGTLTIHVPSRLTMRSGGGLDLFRVRCIIEGEGSVILSTLPGQTIAQFMFGEVIGPQSTFSGGTRIDENVTVDMRGSSFPTTGLTISRGPLGVGTCNMNGGTMFFSLGSFTIGNHINVTANSKILSKGNDVTFHGQVRTNGNRLTLETFEDADRALVFDNAGWSALDTGTLSLVEGSHVEFNVNAGTALLYGGYVGERTGTLLTGSVRKFGDGVYEARHFRVDTLTVDAGTLRVPSELSGVDPGTLHTSVVRYLEIDNSSTGGQLDLRNNGLIIDYDGKDPLEFPSGSTPLIEDLRAGYNGGAWDGRGIITSLAQGATPARGVGYAKQTDLGWTTFAGVTLDSTSIPMRMTLLGDSNLDKTVDIVDFAIFADHFNTANYWYYGDYDYSGYVDIGDFSALAANFNLVLSRGQPSILQQVYVMMLNYPALYWDARDRPDIWWRFEAFDAMSLGAIPPRPVGDRTVPEPALASIVALLFVAGRRAGRRAG